MKGLLNMKRLLSLILALICVVSMAACTGTSSSKNDDDKPKSTQKAPSDSEHETDSTGPVDTSGKDTSTPDTSTPDTTPVTSMPTVSITEAEARVIAESFMNAMIRFDDAEMSKYIDDPSSLSSFTGLSGTIESLQKVPEGMEAYSEDWTEMMNIVVERILTSYNYTITKSEKTADNEYTFTVNLTAIRSSKAEIEDALSVITAHFTESNIQAVTMELVYAGKITQTMTQQQMVDIVIHEIFEDAKQSARGLTFKTSTAAEKLVVNMKTGTLLIDAEASGF